MGQAKNRGTFEERKAAAIVRDEKAAEERVRKAEEAYAQMSPTERVRQRKAALYLCRVGALWGSCLTLFLFTVKALPGCFPILNKAFWSSLC